MRATMRQSAIPLYLFLCLLLGGSTQGVWNSLLLQLLAIAIIAWALIEVPAEPVSVRGRQLFAILIATFALGFVHLLPLAPAIWQALPGRDFVVEGYELLGVPLPWLPISLAPYATIATLLTLLPPAAVLLGILRLRAFRSAWLILALAAGTIISVCLGVLQVSAGSADSGWYLYPFTNQGVATGFFANANHFAILLVVLIPFLAAGVATARAKQRQTQRAMAVTAAAAAAALILVVGIAINGSLAAIGLGVPTLVASSLLLIRRRSRLTKFLLPAAGLLLAAATVVLFATSRTGLLSEQAEGSVTSRAEMASTSLRSASDFAPFGSGIGTFAQVYRLEEDAGTVRRTFVNHAHNDYLEIAVEAGLPGLLLLAGFLVWWVAAAVACWRSEAGSMARAGTIATAVILAHSLVDYPLRVSAIAAVFAMGLGLMLTRTKVAAVRRETDTLRPSRHLQVDDLKWGNAN